MTTWNNRLLPWPLLVPGTDDYRDARFSASTPGAVLHNGKDIIFPSSTILPAHSCAV